MYSGGSIVGKASTVISHTPPLIFTGELFVKKLKSAKFGDVFYVSQVWAGRVWKCSKISERWNTFRVQKWLPYVHAKFGEVGSTPRTPENRWAEMCHRLPPKIARRKRARPKSSITQPWIIQFCSDFVRSLNTWQLKCRKSSRSKDHNQGRSAT